MQRSAESIFSTVLWQPLGQQYHRKWRTLSTSEQGKKGSSAIMIMQHFERMLRKSVWTRNALLILMKNRDSAIDDWTDLIQSVVTSHRLKYPNTSIPIETMRYVGMEIVISMHDLSLNSHVFRARWSVVFRYLAKTYGRRY